MPLSLSSLRAVVSLVVFASSVKLSKATFGPGGFPPAGLPHPGLHDGVGKDMGLKWPDCEVKKPGDQFSRPDVVDAPSFTIGKDAKPDQMYMTVMISTPVNEASMLIKANDTTLLYVQPGFHHPEHAPGLTLISTQPPTVPYKAPKPEPGHAYLVVAMGFKEPEKFKMPSEWDTCFNEAKSHDEKRHPFDAMGFVKKAGLGEPVAAAWFIVTGPKDKDDKKPKTKEHQTNDHEEHKTKERHTKDKPYTEAPESACEAEPPTSAVGIPATSSAPPTHKTKPASHPDGPAHTGATADCSCSTAIPTGEDKDRHHKQPADKPSSSPSPAPDTGAPSPTSPPTQPPPEASPPSPTSAPAMPSSAFKLPGGPPVLVGWDTSFTILPASPQTPAPEPPAPVPTPAPAPGPNTAPPGPQTSTSIPASTFSTFAAPAPATAPAVPAITAPAAAQVLGGGGGGGAAAPTGAGFKPVASGKVVVAAGAREVAARGAVVLGFVAVVSFVVVGVV